MPPAATHTHAQGEKNARLRAGESLCGLFADKHGSPCSIRDKEREKVAEKFCMGVGGAQVSYNQEFKFRMP